MDCDLDSGPGARVNAAYDVLLLLLLFSQFLSYLVPIYIRQFNDKEKLPMPITEVMCMWST